MTEMPSRRTFLWEAKALRHVFPTRSPQNANKPLKTKSTYCFSLAAISGLLSEKKELAWSSGKVGGQREMFVAQLSSPWRTAKTVVFADSKAVRLVERRGSNR